MIKKCKKHGDTEYRLESNGKNRNKRWSCIKCRNERVRKRKVNNKNKAIEKLGGACKICGYNKYYGALAFYYVDSHSEKVNISSLRGCNYAKLEKELDRCVLLCMNCCAEVQSNEYEILG